MVACSRVRARGFTQGCLGAGWTGAAWRRLPPALHLVESPRCLKPRAPHYVIVTAGPRPVLDLPQLPDASEGLPAVPPHHRWGAPAARQQAAALRRASQGTYVSGRGGAGRHACVKCVACRACAPSQRPQVAPPPFATHPSAAANMDQSFPDATEEDLQRADHVCIICREEMQATGEVVCTRGWQAVQAGVVDAASTGAPPRRCLLPWWLPRRLSD